MSDEKEPKEDEVEDDLEDEDAVAEDDDDLEDEAVDEDDDDLEDEAVDEDDDDLEDEEDDEDDEDDEDGGDLGERVLCVDGSCIGLVGTDGRCKVCGTEDPDYEPPSTADTASADGDSDSDEDDGEDDEQDGDDPEDEGDETSGAGSDDPLDFANRVLCSDGACVGVIGSDGRCRECGKPLSPDDD